ncbi:hypothetical protein FHR74_001781 [Sphingomonas aerolata]|nr:hypothetical protein [Sphingomonas aerolata]
MKWFGAAGFLIACVSILPPSAFSAQFGTDLPHDKADVFVARYADCIIRDKKTRLVAIEFVRSIPDTAEYADLASKASNSKCLSADASRPGSITMMIIQPNVFRDALYPALYRRQFWKAPDMGLIKDLPPLNLASEFNGPLAALPATYRPERALGDCVARSSPVAAHVLLISRPWSLQDTGAADQLKPAIASCLGEGKTIRLTRRALRAYIGEAMFKLVSASPKA